MTFQQFVNCVSLRCAVLEGEHPSVGQVLPGVGANPRYAIQALVLCTQRDFGFESKIPLRKVGRPADVAAATVFLSSARLAGHITGQMIVTGGGMEGRVLYLPDEVDPSEA